MDSTSDLSGADLDFAGTCAAPSAGGSCTAHLAARLDLTHK